MDKRLALKTAPPAEMEPQEETAQPVRVLSQHQKLYSEGFRAAATTNGNLDVLHTKIRRVVLVDGGLVSIPNQEVLNLIPSVKRKIENGEDRLEDLERKLIAFQDESLDAGTCDDAAPPDSLEFERSELRKLREKWASRPSPARSQIVFGIQIASLVLLTAYLVLFYVSVGHAALTKDTGSVVAEAATGDVTGLFHAIFEASALSQVLAAHNYLVLFFPVVFLTFGLLIHPFWQKGHWTGLASLVVTTFLFDVILAYQITRQAHDIQRLTGLTETSFDFGTALTDVGFWTVIASGFFVYLAWGVLFHFAWENFPTHQDPEIQALTKIKEEHIQRVEQAREQRTRELAAGRKTRKEELRVLIEATKEELETNLRTLAELQHQKRVVLVSEIEARVNSFLDGWLTCLAALQSGLEATPVQISTAAAYQVASEEKEFLIKTELSNWVQ